MTIERITKLEARVDHHDTLHAQHKKDLALNAASIAALEENTRVTTHLTEVMGNLIEALAWASKVAKGILWIVAAISAAWVTAKFIYIKLLGYL